ncbi:T9SS C-terminal target domain-containing protein [Bergeyella porcorum]|uniref:T9SS C-terminal target domain-containing protein n=1 Tax=Bergeyella porcorum TaxID=1735111 RepID=A0AAU0F2E0_9FLAO
MVFDKAYSLLFLLFSIVISAQYISVDDSSYTDEQLVRDIFLGANAGCINISNITITGDPRGSSYGYFHKNNSSFPMDRGIILTTGKANNAKGPNSEILNDGDRNWSGDGDLEQATYITRTTNATILEFDFIASESSNISFEYLFASEQYLRNSDRGSCGYTDGFAFLIKKAGTNMPYTNLAVIPNTTIPITSETVRGNGGKCPAANAQYFDSFNDYNSPTNYNGQTKILTASTTIEAGVKYHIKLVIADQGNNLYDSAVFLKANSFSNSINLGEDRLLENSTALCPNTIHILDASITGATAYQWYKDGNLIATTPTLTVTESGVYSVVVHKESCSIQGQIKIEYETLEITNQLTLCDDNLDGIINLENEVSPMIFRDDTYDDIRYYTNESGSKNYITQLDVSSSRQHHIFVEVTKNNCLFVDLPLTISLHSPISLNPISPINLCDNELKGYAEVNLSDYATQLNATASTRFFSNEIDAQNNINPISSQQSIQSDKTFYIRFSNESETECPAIGKIDFKFKQPKKSEILKPEYTICKNENILLEVEKDFDSYRWSNGETSSSISVPVGDYYVDLEYNGCIYRQYIRVKPAVQPQISHIDVKGNTLTITASGGTPPYQYSWSGLNGNFVEYNTFSNIPLGIFTVYVADANGCTIVSKEFINLNLINTITPNGDGINEILDYSQLNIKKAVKIQVFDRYGKLVFTNREGQLTWDGKSNGRVVSTGTYWYLLSWIEPDTQEAKQYQSWIVVKNQ